MTYEQIKDILIKHDQLHLLKYYDKLTEEQQANLLAQISSVNWHLLELLQNRQDTETVKGKLEPLGALEVSEIEKRKEEFTQIGIEALKAQKVGAVLLAGGQGTRLGFDKPKGMFNVGITKDLYIFECLIHNLMDVVNQIDTWVPLYIMTSDKNHEDTVHFFEEKHYFGYNKEFIHFFKQEMAPSVDFNGKLLMEDKDRLSLSPNGNGGWFHSLQNAGLISHMK